MNGTTAVNAADEQRSDRQHTGLRTLDEHYSAQEVFRACHAQYGTGILEEKDRQRGQASSERVHSSRARPVAARTDGKAGERGVSL